MSDQKEITETREAHLERLLERYSQHVYDCEGVDYLESGYKRTGTLSDEEWTEIRRICRPAKPPASRR